MTNVSSDHVNYHTITVRSAREEKEKMRETMCECVRFVRILCYHSSWAIIRHVLSVCSVIAATTEVFSCLFSDEK